MDKPGGWSDWLQVLAHLVELAPGGDGAVDTRRTGLLVAAVCAVLGLGYGAWYLLARPQAGNYDIPLYGFAFLTLCGLGMAGYGWLRERGE